MNTGSGVLCLDKPEDITSFSCCAVVRRLLGIKKVGHAGTLDPMATGVLPLLCGSATRALSLLPSHDKAYIVTLRFGYESDTQDVWGSELRRTGGRVPAPEEIEAALPAFTGAIMQLPPMMSALKKDGVRLYTLARQGIEIEREQRPVTISELTVLGAADDTLTLHCTCSQGTYMRTLCVDLAHALGTDAVMTALRRTMAAGFPDTAALPLEEAKERAAAGTLWDAVLPTDSLFSYFGDTIVTEAQAVRFGNGGALALDRLRGPVTDVVRVYAPDGRFLGLGEPCDGELRIRKLF